MPSFDVVSEVDMHEVTNAVDQANREVGTRFDFKGSDSRFEVEGEVIKLSTQSDFQLKQMMDVLTSKLARREVDVGCLDVAEPELAGQEARQKVTLRQGIDKDLARKIVKRIKDGKHKVQAAVQGDQVRVTGKKRDDLQAVMADLRQAELGLPLQFTNFRD
jgi:cyclic-di-GMP-binding protein